MDVEVDYEAVFKAVVTPMLLLTTDFVMVAASDSYLQVTQRTSADLLGRHLFAVFPGNPDVPDDPNEQGVECLRASLERVIATGERDTMALQRYDVEASGRPGAFEERYWSAVNTPVLGRDGKVELVIHSTEDVTEFVQQLRRTGERDFRAPRTVTTDVYARARELQSLNERLKRAQKQQSETTAALREAIERQRRLVFDASHDLRTPITALLTELEEALEEPGIDLQHILRKLLHDAERLNEIVADLLELARLDTSAPAGAELVDLGRFVTEELERRPLKASVRTRLESDVMVRVSRIRLARLLGNLLANAERHTATMIELVVTADPPHAVLEVIDDGPGIAPEDRERIFERLCRLDDARQRDPGGSGLGLPIAREIARVYGGWLSAAEHARGARFVLHLPLVAKDAPAPPANRPL